MDLCFSLKCTKNRDDDYHKRGGNFYTIPSYVTENYTLSCHTNNFNSLITLKNNGNHHYKSYKFEQAVHSYTKALSSFTQEKNNSNNSFEYSNGVVNDIDQNSKNNGHMKKNSNSIPIVNNSMTSIPSHISSPLATSSNVNIMINNKSTLKPVSENSSYHILKKKGEDEFIDEHHGDTSFNSSSPKSPDINPKTEFISHLENQYQAPSQTQNVEVQRKSKSKRHKNKNKNNKSNRQPTYTPHPKVKPSDVMILYTTLLANRSASYIRLKNFKNANADAERIIEIRPNWIKV